MQCFYIVQFFTQIHTIWDQFIYIKELVQFWSLKYVVGSILAPKKM